MVLKNWEIVPIPVDDYDQMMYTIMKVRQKSGPITMNEELAQTGLLYFKGTFHIGEEGIHDTFLKLEGWMKVMIFECLLINLIKKWVF